MNELLKLELRVLACLQVPWITPMTEFQVEAEGLALISVDIHQKKIR